MNTAKNKFQAQLFTQAQMEVTYQKASRQETFKTGAQASTNQTKP